MATKGNKQQVTVYGFAPPKVEEEKVPEVTTEVVGLDWLYLPEVVLLQILFFLEPRDVVWGVELTCASWKKVSSSEFLWEALHRRLFGGKKPEMKGAGKGREGDELNWREHCLRSSRYLTYMRNQQYPEDNILRWCCACGHLALFSRMLREGYFSHEMLNGGDTPESGARDTESNKRTTMTPVHLASMSGNARMTEILARSGVDINRRDSKGVSPLSIAAKMGHLSVVEVLLRYGAVADEFTKLLDCNQSRRKSKGKGREEGLPLLHSAIAGGHTQIVEKLLERAAEKGNLAVLSSLDKKQRTPLHWAADVGHVPLLELLIRRGAPIQPRAGDFCTPLHCAVGKNRLEAARFLLEKKASASLELKEKMALAAKGTEGEKSPLQIACERGLWPMTKLLLEFGGDIHMRSKGKARSILHFVVTGGQGSVSLVQYLVGKVDVNAKDKKGSMPIHRLCSHPTSIEAKQLLMLLVQNKASVHAKGREDQAPLEILLGRWIKLQGVRETGKERNRNACTVREMAEILLANEAVPNERLMNESGLWEEGNEDLNGVI